MKRPARFWIYLAALTGFWIRVALLAISRENHGYYGGDTIRYLEQAQSLLSGHLSFEGMYPLGYPSFLALFIALFKSPWASALCGAVVNSLFTLWFCGRLESSGFARRGVIATAWFLSLDPIWVSESVIIGADFWGAALFGFVFMSLLELSGAPRTKPSTRPEPSLLSAVLTRAAIGGYLIFVCATIKPVYLYVPLLLGPALLTVTTTARHSRLKTLSAFLAFWFIPSMIYAALHQSSTGQFSFSGHNEDMVGRYIVGQIYVGEGHTNDMYEGMKMAGRALEQGQTTDPSLTWTSFIIGNIRTHPEIFTRLLGASVYKTVFGHGNVPLYRFFTGHDIEGPGLWIIFSRSGNLIETIKNVNWAWIAGMLAELISKLVLLTLAARGFWNLWNSGRSESRPFLISSALLVAYFALSPIVFGEPRYFLPATVILLWLANWACVRETASS